METKPTATPKKRYLSHSQGYRGKTLSFKNSTKQSFSELPSVLHVSRVHSLVKAMFPTNPVPEVPLA